MNSTTGPDLEAEPPDPELLITYGDGVFYGMCNLCQADLGLIRPDQSVGILMANWERHTMTGACTA